MATRDREPCPSPSLSGRARTHATALLMAFFVLACSSGPAWPPLRALPGVRVLPTETTPRTGFTVVEPAGGKIGYSGLLTEAGLEALKKADKEGVTILLVRSQGGEGPVGIQFGDWVHARGLDVVVVDYCISACANYVFTAGWHKTILPGAIVAWQGNNRVRGADARAERDHTGEVLEEMRAEEDAFFKRIGVSECICRVGDEAALGGPSVTSSRSPGGGFFTMTPEDMRRFGVEFVEASPERQEDVNPVLWKWLQPRFVTIPPGEDAKQFCSGL